MQRQVCGEVSVGSDDDFATNGGGGGGIAMVSMWNEKEMNKKNGIGASSPIVTCLLAASVLGWRWDAG